MTQSTPNGTPGSNVTVQSLLDAGAHFGHQTQRWNPKMLPFIYCERNGIHIINLDITLRYWEKARKFVQDVTTKGGSVLFVGTKQQSREIVAEQATRSGAFYVTNRWLGGTLSNFTTIRTAIERMKKLEELLVSSLDESSKIRLVKKERVTIQKQLDKLQASLGGIREMRKLPSVVFVTDVVKEEIAVAEARRLHIPVVGIVDTNADPQLVDYPIPANDDAPRVAALMVTALADSIIEGRRVYEATVGSRDEHRSEGRRGRRERITQEETPSAPVSTEATAS